MYHHSDSTWLSNISTAAYLVNSKDESFVFALLLFYKETKKPEIFYHQIFEYFSAYYMNCIAKKFNAQNYTGLPQSQSHIYPIGSFIFSPISLFNISHIHYTVFTKRKKTLTHPAICNIIFTF